MPMSEERINRFKYHPAKSDQVKTLHQQVRDISALFASVIVELTPAGREQSLALTKIEEAMMWATASIARDPANAEQEEEADPLELLTFEERDKLPFVLREGMDIDQVYRVGHLHGKDGRCIRNRYGPLCIDPGKTEDPDAPKVVIMREQDILARANDDDLTGMQPLGFDS